MLSHQFFSFRVERFETVFVGWGEDVLTFGGGVSLEGSSSSDSPRCYTATQLRGVCEIFFPDTNA